MHEKRKKLLRRNPFVTEPPLYGSDDSFLKIYSKLLRFFMIILCINLAISNKLYHGSSKAELKLKKKIDSNVETNSILHKIVHRTTKALGRCILASCQTYISTAILMTPVGLVMNFPPKAGFKTWMSKGTGLADNWARISTLYAGAEILLEGLRAKEDRLNSYIASGLTSAFVQRQEGPMGALKGFVFGYGIVYLMDLYKDRLLPPPGTVAVLSGSSAAGSGSALSSSKKTSNPPTSRL
eukprot:gene11919-24967_t